MIPGPRALRMSGQGGTRRAEDQGSDMNTRKWMLSGLFAVWMPAAIAAGAGELDPTFGSGGRRVVAFDLGGDLSEGATASLVGSDGSITVVGYALVGDFGESRIALTRLKANGAIDTSFGTNGRASYVEPTWYAMRGLDGALLPDGRILVAGNVRKNGTFTNHAVLCRFLSDGDIDTSFGDPATAGCRAYEQGGYSGVTLRANGQIIAAGSERLQGDSRAVLARMDTDGDLDLTFGTQGRAVRTVDAYFGDVDEADDGSLVAVGIADSPLSPKFVMAAFEADGSPDFEFADSGGVVVIANSQDKIFWGQAVEVAPDGSYVASGSVELVEGEGLRPVVFRLKQDGGAVPGFAPFGFRIYDICDAPCGMRGNDLRVGADNSITVAGTFSPDDTSEKTDMYAMRLLANGQPDLNFGDQDPDLPGVAVVGFDLLGGESFDSASAIELQGEKVLLVGYARSTKGPDDTDIAIARLADGLALFKDGFE